MAEAKKEREWVLEQMVDCRNIYGHSNPKLFAEVVNAAGGGKLAIDFSDVPGFEHLVAIMRHKP